MKTGSVTQRILMVATFVLWVWPAASVGGMPPVVGGPLQRIVLQSPEDAVHREYLGVAGDAAVQVDRSAARHERHPGVLHPPVGVEQP